MPQILLAILTIVSAALVLLAAQAKLRYSGGGLVGLLDELDLLMTYFPGKVAFFMFSITAAIAASVIAAFSHITSLWIMTLDILFILSSFMLVKYHQLKLHPSASL